MAAVVASALLAGGLAAVHVLAGRLRFLQVVPRSRWLSAAGGVSVAYVFVHVLPEVTARQAELAREAGAATTVAGERLLFLVVLAGFAAYYGLEQLARRSRPAAGGTVAGGAETRTTAPVFWVHVGSFVAYNVLVGYLLLHREEPGFGGLLLYATAMGVHFLVNDYGLRDHHREAYDRVGRWVLAGAVLVGVAVGALVAVPEPVVGLLFAFLAGGLVLNVVKEELPAERESRFWAFGVGAAGYAAVLVLV